MKQKAIIFVLFLILFSSLSASADSEVSTRENPSLYSFAEIVHGLPEMWGAPVSYAQQMMNGFPDFACYFGEDFFECDSINNRFSPEIYVSFGFSNYFGYLELDDADFTMRINSTEDIQKVIEAFWLDGMKPMNAQGYDYTDGYVTIYFHTDNTLMKYSFAFDENGNPGMLTVHFGCIRG